MANSGLSAANLVTPWLNTMKGNATGVTFTAPAALYCELHTGEPGPSGTSAVSVGSTTRLAIAFTASAAGSALALTGGPYVWTDAATSESITNLAVFSLASAGTFYFSVLLTTPQPWVATNTFTLNTLTFALTPQAA